MLKRLNINNYALIREASVEFPGSLTVVTGETGAGKSIFLEALGLALGRRADQSALASKAKKCVVEAEFDISGLDCEGFFEDNSLEPAELVILRREIGADGRSRSLINDAAVPLNVLKQLAERLVDVHSQHQTLLLNKGDFQLGLVDAFAGTSADFSAYRKTYQQLGKEAERLKSLEAQEAQARKETDYYQFLFSELEEAGLKSGEMKRLEEEAYSLENAEAIKSALLGAADTLGAGDTSILTSLAQVKQALQGLVKFGKQYESYSERFISAYIELKELSAELADAGAEVGFDQARLSEINGSLDRLNRLLKKHGVPDEDGLIAAKKDVEEKLLKFGSVESQIQESKKEHARLLRECVAMAEKLSAQRAKSLPGIEKQVKASLSVLGMEHAQFKIQVAKAGEPGPPGFDEVSFLFTANKGGTPSELQKVASGGELSRLMLTLKALLAEKKKLPCIVFDEIDTGVSGEVADKIGTILQKMGSRMQVIAITHLPQLASKGRHHLFVYKEEQGTGTISFIRDLSEDERVNEIAKMLSRGKPTATALSNARELLAQ